MVKRIFLFFVTNLLVIATISIVMSFLGVGHYIEGAGINYESLLVFCFLWGMGGAFISLLMSKTIAKWTAGVKIIHPRRASGMEARLVERVHALAQKARLPKMPEVGIYKSKEVNAFATGATKSNSLVAVSTGLIESMDEASVEGVLAHEVAHIANGDMVTMTLVQGVVNSFALFLSRIVAFAITRAMSSNDDEGFSGGYFFHYIIVFVLDIAFTMLGSIVVFAFSRHREFKADLGGARLGGRENMLSALKSLSAYVNRLETERTAVSALKISGKGKALSLFASHPPLSERIKRLQASRLAR